MSPLCHFYKTVFLLYLWGSLVTLKLFSLIPLVGSLQENPLALKLLDNRLYMVTRMKKLKLVEEYFAIVNIWIAPLTFEVLQA